MESILFSLVIILINAITISVFLKKKIDETIIVSIVFLALIVYICGLINNLQLGIKIIEILTAIEMIYISIALIKEKGNTLKLFITPGLFLYIFLIIISVFINKNRIFEKFDEFNHWAVAIKNMFAFNNFGINENAIIRFSEYPPFTNIVQYLFIGIKNIYREDIIIIAQNILYFSIMLPIAKKVEWNKSLINMLIIIPIIMFLPMIFYENFYYEILVDGLLGIMLAYVVYQLVTEEDNLYFKYIKIFTGLIMLSLTKTTGIALAILCIIATILNLFKSKKTKREKNMFLIIVAILIVFVSLWYIKTSGQTKNWNFSNYTKITDYLNNETINVGKELIKNLFTGRITNIRKIPIIYYILIITIIQIIILLYYKNKEIKEYKKYKYYSIMLLITVFLCIIAIYISYITIFEREEADRLASFGRYISTVLLANITFIIMYLINLKERKFNNIFLILFAIITILFIPFDNIKSQYTYNLEHNTVYEKKIRKRGSAVNVTRYVDILKNTDKIMYLTSEPKYILARIRIIKYEMIPIAIDKITLEDISSQDEFINIAANYNYVYVNKLMDDDKEFIKDKFENNVIKNETLYVLNENNIFIEVGN